MSIFTLGPEGTYAHQAALTKFPDSEIYFLSTISEVFEKVDKNKNSFGVVPLENMIEGTVRETLDLLYESDLKITDITEVDIHHCLIAQSNDYEIILSHEQAIAQCRKFLKVTQKNKIIQSVNSTAEGAKRAQEYSQYAAIANPFAAEKYGLQILHKNIEDYPNNKTLFPVIGHKFSPNYSKTSLAITPTKNDEPGLLIKLLYPFQENGVNLTKLESRPQKTEMNNYIFFIDIEADFRQAKIRKIFTYLEKDLKLCKIKVLGGKI